MMKLSDYPACPPSDATDWYGHLVRNKRDGAAGQVGVVLRVKPAGEPSRPRVYVRFLRNGYEQWQRVDELEVVEPHFNNWLAMGS